MSKLSRRTRSGGAFTLVELVIVIVIVAILALIAIPLYTGNTTGAIMSEGVASAGTIQYRSISGSTKARALSGSR